MLLILLFFLSFFAFPYGMRREYGRTVGWRCERCGKSFFDGWLIEFHHKLPTNAGGLDTWDNIEALCTEDHYLAHVDLRKQGLDHPYSAQIVYARLQQTCGGRTREWLEKNRDRVLA